MRPGLLGHPYLRSDACIGFAGHFVPHLCRGRRRSTSSFAGCHLSGFEQFVIEIKETVPS
jgi:hypothetical protein